METEREVWRYGAKVYGVKNKCRKEDWHLTGKSELGESDSLCEETAKKLAKNWIIKNMRKVKEGKCFATAKLWRISGDMEEWRPFEDSENKVWKLGEQENAENN